MVEVIIRWSGEKRDGAVMVLLPVARWGISQILAGFDYNPVRQNQLITLVEAASTERVRHTLRCCLVLERSELTKGRDGFATGEGPAADHTIHSLAEVLAIAGL